MPAGRSFWLSRAMTPAGRSVAVGVGLADSPHGAGSRYLASDCREHAVATERLRDLSSELRVNDSAEGFKGFSPRSAV